MWASIGLGLVNCETAEVAAVRNRRVTFRLEDGRMLGLTPGDPQLRHVDRAWASTVHAFQGRTVDTVIAAMEANHPNLTTQKSFYVEISRAPKRVNHDLGLQGAGSGTGAGGAGCKGDCRPKRWNVGSDLPAVRLSEYRQPCSVRTRESSGAHIRCDRDRHGSVRSVPGGAVDRGGHEDGHRRAQAVRRNLRERRLHPHQRD